MKPFGGLALIVHIGIIVIKWIKTNPLPSLVIAAVTFLVFIGAGTSITQSWNGSPNVAFIADLFYRCKPIKISEEGGNIAIIRLDDVQAFAWSGITKEMIEDAIAVDIPLTLGVIPFRLEEDGDMTRFLKRNSCSLEMALHGWNNRQDVPEFEAISEAQAREKIKKGKPIVEKLSSKPVITFIPPNNKYSEGTAAALEKEGFKIISAEGDGYFDYTVSTYNFEKTEAIATEDIIKQCAEAFDESKPCIIMIHPQDYATGGALDEKKYADYRALLIELKKLGPAFLTMSDMHKRNTGK